MGTNRRDNMSVEDHTARNISECEAIISHAENVVSALTSYIRRGIPREVIKRHCNLFFLIDSYNDGKNSQLNNISLGCQNLLEEGANTALERSVIIDLSSLLEGDNIENHITTKVSMLLPIRRDQRVLDPFFAPSIPQDTIQPLVTKALAEIMRGKVPDDPVGKAVYTAFRGFIHTCNVEETSSSTVKSSII